MKRSEQLFAEQWEFANQHVAPLLRKRTLLYKCKAVDIGCGEGGLVHLFSKKGMVSHGLEKSISRFTSASHINQCGIFVLGDICSSDLTLPENYYDIATMIDVIEHISNKRKAIYNVFNLLKKDGMLYITFPTSKSPFAGHQQNLKSPLKYLPYLSLFPKPVISLFGRIFKENVNRIIENKNNAISDREFIQMVYSMELVITHARRYISRPVFKIRYGLPTIEALNIPVIGEYLQTGSEYIIERR